MVEIDVDSLREHLTEYCGSAMFNGSPAALLDLADISGASGLELCRKAEELGVDLERYMTEKCADPDWRVIGV